MAEDGLRFRRAQAARIGVFVLLLAILTLAGAVDIITRTFQTFFVIMSEDSVATLHLKGYERTSLLQVQDR